MLFYVNASIYLIILLENQVFIPDFPVGKLSEKLYNLKNFGIRGEELVVDIGAIAKMNEFCALMGLCNLNHIDEAIAERRENSEYYINELRDIRGIELFKKNLDGTDNYAYFPILVNEEYGRSRDELYDWLKYNGIYSRKYFCPITADQACFRNKYKKDSLDYARKLSQQILVLPLYQDMQTIDIERICKYIKNYGRR